MDLFTAVKERRSVRSFSEAPVSDEQVVAVLEAGTWAPSGGNMQPWQFIVIRDQQLRERLVSATYVGYDRLTGPPQKWMLGAPVIIFVGLDAKRSGARYGTADAGPARLDCAACVQNMLLAVTALGLGACWVAGFDRERVAEVLGLGGDVVPFSLVPIGHPSRVQPAPYRLPLEDVTEYR